MVRFRKLIPNHVPQKQAEDILLKALEFYLRHLEMQRLRNRNTRDNAPGEQSALFSAVDFPCRFPLSHSPPENRLYLLKKRKQTGN
jgi:hypothetical protein